MVDLQKFCAVGDLREYLLKPFDIEGVGHIGCNGHIAVVLPAEVTTTAGLPVSIKEAMTRMSASVRNTAQGRHVVMSELAIPDPVPCVGCQGTGKCWPQGDCDDCDGDGYFAYGNNTYTCKECNGSGHVDTQAAEKVVCASCDGSGEGFQTFGVHYVDFQTRYLRMLKDLPGCLLYPRGLLDSTYFMFDGGWGVLMPCRK